MPDIRPYEILKPSRLRFVMKDGKKILQQEWIACHHEDGEEVRYRWTDVPFVEDGED